MVAVMLFTSAIVNAQQSKPSNIVVGAGPEVSQQTGFTYMTYEASVGFQTDPSDNCAYAQAFGFPMLSAGFAVANMGDFKFADNSKFSPLYALYGSFERATKSHLQSLS